MNVAPKKFAESTIPDANDGAALADWKRDDVRQIVLPLAVTAAWAYADKPTFDQVMQRRSLARPGETSARVEIRNDAMFVVASASIQPIHGGVIVAFRGTEPTDLINWLADASLKGVAFHAKSGTAANRGHVHDGFYRNTRAVFPEVIDVLNHLDPSFIYITGHSFGGALAVLAGALLADYATEKRNDDYGKYWDRVRAIVTFGQPMVGDADFQKHCAEHVTAKLSRFVYADDIVPHLPPSSKGWEPVHFGTAWHGSEREGWTQFPAGNVPKTASVLAGIEAVGAWIREQAGFEEILPHSYSWGDHAPNNYVRTSLPNLAESGSEFD